MKTQLMCEEDDKQGYLTKCICVYLESPTGLGFLTKSGVLVCAAHIFLQIRTNFSLNFTYGSVGIHEQTTHFMNPTKNPT